METTQILFKIKLTSVHIFLTSYLSGTGYEPAIHAIQLTKVSSFLMGHFFVFVFSILLTVNNVQYKFC